METFSLKYKETFYKFTSLESISALLKFCSVTLNINKPQLSYIDEESEKIIVDCELDLNEAIPYLISSGQHLQVEELETPGNLFPPCSLFRSLSSQHPEKSSIRNSFKLSELDLTSSEIFQIPTKTQSPCTNCHSSIQGSFSTCPHCQPSLCSTCLPLSTSPKSLMLHRICDELGFPNPDHVAKLLESLNYDYNETVSRLLDL